MLLKGNRLRRDKDLERVFKNGRFFKEDFLSFKILFNNLKNNRFAFIVSSKVSKKAVLRNKIRRWLRAAVLLQLKQERLNGENQKSVDVIIVVQPGREVKNFQEVKDVINKIFKKIKYGIFN